jgi:L-ascorbate metabolism protein UlaG (beta-lactamase superfamily)
MIYLLIIPLGIILAFQLMGHFLSAPKYKGPVSDHFDGKKFINPGGVQARGLGDLLKWMTNRERGKWERKISSVNGAKPQERVNGFTRITFINHTTFLIQTDALNILTDPVYSERVSPFSFAGPKRMRPPGIPFEELPKIDVVLLSHNHYDHLDIHTVKRLKNIFDPVFVAPLGVAAYLRQNGVVNVQELDWWQTTSLHAVEIIAVPAQHFSGRGTFDRDATLWCGYVVKSESTSLCFVGDTGYNEKTFKDIPRRTGNIDIAIIPIGAYKPSWFMSPIHCSPEEAVKIHLDLVAPQSIASHFGTFPLADDAQLDPIHDLQIARKKFSVKDEAFVTMEEGTSIDFKKKTS